MGDVVNAAQVQPTNKIVVDSTGIHIQTMKVESATNMYAGRLVIQGTNDDDASVCGSAGEALGWLGYEHTAKKYRPATVDTIYAQDAQAAIVNGPGILIVGHLASGQNLDKGSYLMAAANGELSGATVGTHHVVAIAEESKNAAASPWACDIIVRSLI